MDCLDHFRRLSDLKQERATHLTVSRSVESGGGAVV